MVLLAVVAFLVGAAVAGAAVFAVMQGKVWKALDDANEAREELERHRH